MASRRETGDWAAWMSGAGSPHAGGAAGHGGPAGSSGLAAAAPERQPDAPGPVDGTSPAVAATVAHGGGDTGADPHRSPRREATRQRILDAAREVFAERGVIGGTVEDICERAGFTRGAFYSNFADKDDVVDALMGREHDRLLAHIEESFQAVDRELAEADDLGAAVASIVDRILRSVPLDRQLTLVQTELEIFAVRRPDLAGRFVAINDRFRERIGWFIAEAMLRHGRELLVAPTALTDAIVAVAQASVRRALLAGGDADPDALSSAILPGMLMAFSRPVADPPTA